MKNSIEKKFNDSIKYIAQLINDTSYPIGHPFNEVAFNENDIVFRILAILKTMNIDNVILKDFICNKIRATDCGKFSSERYFQSLSEIVIFYYIYCGVMQNSTNRIEEILYEPISPYNPNKILEYSFLLEDKTYVNIEIKTITCDPLIKEKYFKIKDNKIYIKKYFPGIDINTEQIDKFGIDDYQLLEASTHYRQLRKNIKKIVEKFEGDRNNIGKSLNVGFVVVQFATSIEEFYSYMFHPTKGLLYELDFGNLDCLVFFSLTPKCGLDMQDIYDRHHIFSLVFNGEKYVFDLLELMRLDHIASHPNKKVFSPYREEGIQEFGCFKSIFKEGKFFFTDIHKSEEEIKDYLEYLNGIV